jgi:hypothetical protein
MQTIRIFGRPQLANDQTSFAAVCKYLSVSKDPCVGSARCWLLKLLKKKKAERHSNPARSSSNLTYPASIRNDMRASCGLESGQHRFGRLRKLSNPGQESGYDVD